MPDPDKDILPHSQPPGRDRLPPGGPQEDDDATYDDDEWRDMEDDRDPRNDIYYMLHVWEQRGYFM